MRYATMEGRGGMTDLRTFDLPDAVAGTASDVELGRQLVGAWQRDGILAAAVCWAGTVAALIGARRSR